MRKWSPDHPKARLLDRKRQAILAAARRQFLKNGYGGTSMESIAADACVSIMTLYRHAERKDDLFAAVVSIACDAGDDEAAPEHPALSFADTLVAVGIAFQEKLAHPDTMALLRAVIAEHERFPELARITLEAVIGHIEAFLERLLGAVPEASRLPSSRRKVLVGQFIDNLFGEDFLRSLLGQPGTSMPARRARAERATRHLLGDLERQPGRGREGRAGNPR